MKPIPDKAEVALEYPDKLYIGTFEQSSDFDAFLDKMGIGLTLHRGGDESMRKSVRVHLHYALFAEILDDLARCAASGIMDESHRDALAKAATAFAAALQDPGENTRDMDDVGNLTPAEEVALLHIME
jgi:hypothetical protein